MRILVIDDTEINLDSAKLTLAGHELTLVSSYDEAYRLLEKPYASEEAVKAELKRRGFTKVDPYDRSKEGTPEWEAYWGEYRRIAAELCPPPPFDAVLCDLLMPAGETNQGSRGHQYVGQEMPVGWALAFMAVLQGAKYVAVVTNLDHHDHPAAAMLDPFRYRVTLDGPGSPAKITVNGVRVDFVSESRMIPIDGTTCPECNGSGKLGKHSCHICYGSGNMTAKDWGYHLLAGSRGQQIE